MAEMVTDSLGDSYPKGTKFEKGDFIRCLNIPFETEIEKGFSIYPGEEYEVETASHFYKGEELVELVLNGDGEPCTFYPVKFFEKI